MHKFSVDECIYVTLILSILCQKITPTLFSVRNFMYCSTQTLANVETEKLVEDTVVHSLCYCICTYLSIYTLETLCK